MKFYLIERMSSRGHAIWMMISLKGGPMLAWTTDVEKALQFARGKDAEKFVQYFKLDPNEYRATEHMMMGV